MKPIDSSKISIEDVLAPTRVNKITGEVERIPAYDRIDAILSYPRTRALVASLDPQLLFGLIREVGQGDALDLIELTTPAQLQAFVDYDAWDRDTFELETFNDWMSLVLQRDDDDFEALFKVMDKEAFVLWFRETVAVYAWEEDIDLIERIDDTIYTSPDGQFAFVIPDDEIYGREIRLFIERLYLMDVEKALTLMSEARWALSSELRETLYQARMSRLAEQGYVPYDESLAIFAFVDPIVWTKRERQKLRQGPEITSSLKAGQLTPMEPQLLAIQDALADANRPFFAQALAAISPTLGAQLASDVLESTMIQLRAIAQRVLVADHGTPGDTEELSYASKRAIDTLSLGLEFLTEGEPSLAAKALATIPLRELHRVGYSVTIQLQRQVRTMLKRGNLSVTEQHFSLLEPEDAALCEGLIQNRPVQNAGTGRRFKTVADVQRAAQRLGKIAFAELFFFAWLSMDHGAIVELLENEELNQTPVEMVRFRSLFTTFLLNRQLSPGRALMPLSLVELDKALGQLREQEDPMSTLLQLARGIVDSYKPAEQNIGPFPYQFVDETVTWMVDEMLGHQGATPESVAVNWVLVRPASTPVPEQLKI